MCNFIHHNTDGPYFGIDPGIQLPQGARRSLLPCAGAGITIDPGLPIGWVHMCGIAGVVGLRDEVVAAMMVRRIAHRGPDGEGTWISPFDQFPVMLGSRRLAILDLSVAGHMPMLSKDGRFVISYNGEIFNYRELRKELKWAGHQFSSSGDTEVVLAAYQQWGPSCLSRFNGMFAIAIWDCWERRLFLARDRMGVKPLYYADTGGWFAFSSEIKALVIPGLRRPKINKDMLSTYLRYQYVAWPDTLFEGILKLPPAHYAIYENATLSISRYWHPASRNGTAALSDKDLGMLIDDAVRLRLVSDVPVGVFLSGGVDSSVVCALASRHLDALVSYTVRYDVGEARYDESAAARSAAAFLKVENREVVCAAREAAEKIPTLIWYLDEPVADTLIYPFFALSQAARNTFTVALSGEGSDELFFGYRYYTLERLRRWVAPLLPDFVRRLVHRSLKDRDMSTDMVCRALATVTAKTAEEAFRVWSGATFSHEEIAELLGSPLAESNAGAPMMEHLPKASFTDSRALAPYLDMHFRLVDFILAVRDKMSMAVGLEIRTPFLDFRIVEAAMKIPVARKLMRNRTKVLIHKIAAALLPRSVARRRKVPFSAPIHLWLEPLSKLYFAESELVRDGVLSREGTERWNKFRHGRCEHPYKLWSLLLLEIWYRLFITGSLTPCLLPLPPPVERNTPIATLGPQLEAWPEPLSTHPAG
jgi:asparagine synthase (glutamine-hydrolysing)